MLGGHALAGALVIDIVFATLAATRTRYVAVDEVGLGAGELADTVRPDRTLVTSLVLTPGNQHNFVVIVARYAVLRIAVDPFTRWPATLL